MVNQVIDVSNTRSEIPQPPLTLNPELIQAVHRSYIVCTQSEILKPDFLMPSPDMVVWYIGEI